METISYEYTKARRAFGVHPVFHDSAPITESVASIDDSQANILHHKQQQHQQQQQLSNTEHASTTHVTKQWTESLTTTIELDCISTQASHEVNTERFVQHTKGTSHIDGSWPTEIKTNEF